MLRRNMHACWVLEAYCTALQVQYVITESEHIHGLHAYRCKPECSSRGDHNVHSAADHGDQRDRKHERRACMVTMHARPGFRQNCSSSFYGWPRAVTRAGRVCGCEACIGGVLCFGGVGSGWKGRGCHNSLPGANRRCDETRLGWLWNPLSHFIACAFPIFVSPAWNTTTQHGR